MAKTAKLKTKPQSLKSRAARHATSPSLNLDKSLTKISRPEGDSKPAANPLSTHHNAGVKKKKSKAKPQTRAQRLRLQKGLEKAKLVIDRTEKKVEKSKGRGAVAKERRSNWEDLNEKIGSVKGAKKATKVKEGEGMEEVELENGDVEPLEVSTDATTKEVLENGPQLVVAVRTATVEPEDEIT